MNGDDYWHGVLSQPGSLKATLVSFCLIASKPLKEDAVFTLFADEEPGSL